MIIYQIKNSINDKRYIGQTCHTLEFRKKQHIKDLQKNKHHSIKLQRAWNKYGKSSFIFEQLDLATTLEELNKKEVEWSIKFNSIKYGYNIKECGLYGKHSEETKEKLSQSLKGNLNGSGNKGKPLSKEHIEKIRSRKIGKKHSEETKRKRSESMKGHLVSKETREKISLALQGNTNGKFHKGWSPTNEQRINMSNAHLGSFHTEETKKKMSQTRKNMNFQHSEETKKKISEKNKGRIFTNEHRKKLSESHKKKIQ